MTSRYSGAGDPTQTLRLLWGSDDRQGEPDRARPGPKPKLTLAKIIEAAIAVADRDGVDALSMRNVAAELGAGTMTLYRYLPGKAELLDLVLDRLNGPGEELARCHRTGWRAVLKLIAEDNWRRFLAHPWLLEVNQARPVFGPNSLAGFELALSAFTGLPLTSQEKVHLILAVDSYITGTARMCLSHRQASERLAVTDQEFWAAQYPYLERAMATGDYPEMATMDEDAFSGSDEDTMRLGLDALLDGIGAFIDRRRRASDTGP